MRRVPFPACVVILNEAPVQRGIAKEADTADAIALVVAGEISRFRARQCLRGESRCFVVRPPHVDHERRENVVCALSRQRSLRR